MIDENLRKKNKIEIDDIVIFLFIGFFLFSKILPSIMYRLYTIFFILYFLLKIFLKRKLVLNVGIIWQLLFCINLIFSLLYAKVLYNGILSSFFINVLIILAISQYFDGNSNLLKVKFFLKSFYRWAIIFIIYICFFMLNNRDILKGGGRLGTRGLVGFGGATGYSYYTILISIVVLWWAINNSRSYIKSFSLISGTLYINMLSGGRKALLLPIIVMIINLYYKNKKKMLKFLVILLMLLFFITLVIMNVDFLYQNIGYRVESLFLSVLGRESNDLITSNSDSYRFSLIKQGFEMFEKEPILGYGIGSSRIIYSNLGLGEIHAHNNYIDILISGGILMFLSWYWIYIYVYILILKKASCDKYSILFISLVIVNLLSDLGSTMYNVLHFNLFITLSTIYLKSIVKEKKKYNKLENFLREERKKNGYKLF